MTTSPPDRPAERRLHPAGIALASAKYAGKLLLPIVFFVVLGAGRAGLAGSLASGALTLAFFLALGAVRWWTTTYVVTPDHIAVRSGIASRSEQLVPRSRIASIDTAQGPLERLFGVIELRVQASGGGQAPEVVLSAISHHEARAIRAELGHPAAPQAPDAEWRLSRRALLLAAVTGPQVGFLVPVFAGAAAFYGQASDAGVRADAITDALPGGATGVVLAILGIALAAAATSIAGAVLVFGGFAVWRDDGRLRIRRGLLQRRIATVPLSRVHAVRVVENPIRQLLGVATIRIETTAHAGEDAVEQTLIPLIPRDEVTATLAALVPALPAGARTLEQPPARARRRYATRPAIAGAVTGFVIVVLASSLTWVAWLLVPAFTAAGVAFGLLCFRDAGWALDEGNVTLRARGLTRTTLIARAARLQSESVRVSPFQARAGLATLGVVVGRGRQAQVEHLDDGVALGLFERLRAAAAS